jgi:tRNA G37 N-methylase TrmD
LIDSGVLSDETSALTDSFQDGLLSGPTTRPIEYDGKFGCINERQLPKLISGVKIWLMNTQNKQDQIY